MNIFIDESGRFEVLQNTGVPMYECIVAAVINDAALIKFENQYGDKDKEFLRKNPNDLIELLNVNDCKVFAIVYDANFGSKSTIEKHRKIYIESIYKVIEGHPAFLLKTVDHHAKILSNISLAQYIKALLVIQLLENVLRGVCYESMQFLQHDLTRFNFISDSETDAIKPTIKYFSLFQMFCRSAKGPIQLDTKNNLKHLIHGSGRYLDAKSFFENINFVPSKTSMGVRVADVLVNQLFRILKGELIDYDKITWEKLLSNPYGLDRMHFNMDHEFIEYPIQ